MFKIISFSFIGFLFYIMCSFENKGYAQSKTHGHFPHFHTLQIASLKPSNTCHHSIEEGPSKKGFLKVVHKYGPCSQHEPNGSMRHAEMLLRDESRVHAIQSKLGKKSNDIDSIQGSKATKLPVMPGRNLDSAGNYIIKVGLGTPRKDFTLIFDTSYDLTWTQCQPCSSSCYQQIEPMFSSSDSSSYSNISCGSNLCTQYKSNEGCINPTCIYQEKYGENSYSIGTLSKERLSLTPMDVIRNFVFGCAQNNRGLQFGTTAGLFGLSRDELSFVQQTAQKYNRYFSYCLPSNPSLTGHLSFGHNGNIPKTIQFTPISTISKTNYGLDMTGISIGDKTLPISPIVFARAGMIIDSGSIITHLPPSVYKVMREEFTSLMSLYPRTKGFSSLDTCYDLSGYNSIELPKVTFYFEDGIEVELDESAILFRVTNKQVCFAFAANKLNNQIAIFGSYQQKTMEIIYDVGGERIGFASNGCN